MRVSRNSRGFTLVELLVAAGITVFLASLMVTIIVQAAGLWTRSAERLQCEAIARGIFARVETDLHAAIRHDGSLLASIVPDVADLPSAIWQVAGSHAKPGGAGSFRDAASLAESRFGLGGVWLRLVTTRAGQNRDLESISAPVAVGYRIVHRRRTPAESTAAYVLCRSEVRPGASGSTGPGTHEAGYDLAAAAYLAGTASSSGDPATLAQPFFPGSDSPGIADGIVDFGLRGYVRDVAGAGGLRRIFPSEGTNEKIEPDIIDVMVRILTDTGVQRIARFESGPAVENAFAEAWWTIAEANSHVFTRRIAVVASNP